MSRLKKIEHSVKFKDDNSIGTINMTLLRNGSISHNLLDTITLLIISVHALDIRLTFFFIFCVSQNNEQVRYNA